MWLFFVVISDMPQSQDKCLEFSEDYRQYPELWARIYKKKKLSHALNEVADKYSKYLKIYIIFLRLFPQEAFKIGRFSRRAHAP
jgi:hypothetical protein